MKSTSIESAEQMGASYDLDPKPETMAEEVTAFEYSSARWVSIGEVFRAHIAQAIRQADCVAPNRILDPELTACVRSRFPRIFGDAFIWLDIGSDGPLPLLYQNVRIPVDRIREVFGGIIAEAIEGSDLREWEKRNGYINTTECVEIKPQGIKLRIRYDIHLANKLFN
jgi:hypothetical protein